MPPKATEMINTFGKVETAVNKDSRVVISGTDNMNDFGKKMGYQAGDIILEINGQEVTAANARSIIDKAVTNAPAGAPLEVVVNRKDSKGNFIRKKLTGNITQTAVETTHVLRINPEATTQQKQLQQAWLYN
jgi:membrane-associated protease RseP (regulator of RpoE activity)